MEIFRRKLIYLIPNTWRIQTHFNLVPDPHEELAAQGLLSFLEIRYLNLCEVLCVGDLHKVMHILSAELRSEWDCTKFHITASQRTA